MIYSIISHNNKREKYETNIFADSFSCNLCNKFNGTTLFQGEKEKC